MTPSQKKAYDDALLKMQLKTKGREPKDPAARLRFEMEQEACARISALKYSGFPEPDNDGEDDEDQDEET